MVLYHAFFRSFLLISIVFSFQFTVDFSGTIPFIDTTLIAFEYIGMVITGAIFVFSERVFRHPGQNDPNPFFYYYHLERKGMSKIIMLEPVCVSLIVNLCC
jgi:hypothetical protein